MIHQVYYTTLIQIRKTKKLKNKKKLFILLIFTIISKMSKLYCESFTICGTKCSRKAIVGESFCNQHKNKPNKPKNQCDGLTKKNIRCSKMTENKYCKIHSSIVSQSKCKGLQFDLSQCGTSCSSEYCDTHKYKYRLEKPDDCPICIDKISNEIEIPLECGHWIHKECLKPTNVHKCPVCRQEMKKEEIEYIFGHNHNERNHYADEYNNYMSNMFINSNPEIQVNRNNIQHTGGFVFNMFRTLSIFNTNLRIQDLQPVSESEFNLNIMRLFRDYHFQSNVILLEHGIEIPLVNPRSLYNVIRGDYERYLVFVERLVRGFVINRYGDYGNNNERVSRYTYLFTSELYRGELIYIFNHVNYGIQFPIQSLHNLFHN